MKKRIDKYEFIREMNDYHLGNCFSYDGLSVLYDYLEELEEELGEEIEFDVVALHCQYEEIPIYDFIRYYYDDEDIEEILSKYNLHSIDEITAEIIYDYELCSYNRVIAIVDETSIIVDNERW